MQFKKNIAINRDSVYNKPCRLSHGIHVISICFISFDYILKLIIETMLFLFCYERDFVMYLSGDKQADII